MKKNRLSRRGFLRSASAASVAGLTVDAIGASGKAATTAECGSVWERPPRQTGNNLNLILLVADTFRRDNLACYGSRWIECPNLNAFARDSVIFEDFYPEGMPTVPIRRTLWTGRRIFPLHYYRQPEPVQLPGWHNLYNEDVTLAEALLEAGYIPALVSDIPHLQRPERNFHRGYRMYEWIRGQETDYYGTSPHGLLDVSDIVPSNYLAQIDDLHEFLSQYKANRERWQKGGVSLVELVARATIRWLWENHAQRPFLLHMEAFDPHEPWDPPRRFLEKYLPEASGHTWIEPPYANVGVPEEGTRRMRGNYAGEATCVDFWFGKVLETIGELGLFENSIVVFLSDHGALLGEQEQFLKGPEKLRGQVTHIPLLVRMPGKQFAGKRVAGFVQIPDVLPTLLSLLGLKAPARVTGQNFWPLVTGQTRSLRDHAVMGYGWIAAVRMDEWNYSQIWNPQGYEGEYKPQLYNLSKDAEELHNVADRYPDVTRRLAEKIRDYAESGKELTRGSFHEKESLRMGEVYVKGAR
ncbi:MAG: sulfatase-like hydrolase/transferase [Acidobacteriia bacterium]|nr:sulfatase-like hydrolase/transferase [Terriglobia bacterium]